MVTDDPTPARSPLELLGALAKTDAEISEQSRLVEIYTMEGLLQIWWWGEPGAKDVVIMCGGAMGGALYFMRGIACWRGCAQLQICAAC